MPAVRIVIPACLAILLVTGCATHSHVPAQHAIAARESRSADVTARQTIFYVDGAGGGGPITDGTPDVRRGFVEAGFDGDFRPFGWQTGLGALADEVASVEYKRRAGERLAAEIVRAMEAGQSRISIVATSAGTIVAIFALEALPEGASVESVALLSSAVSADYDLSAALDRISSSLLVFRSERDSLLRSLIPLVGSADRADVGDRVAGLYGFLLPDDADEQRRAAYRKVETVEWCDKLREVDHTGGHTDCKRPRFIRAVVAPRLIGAKPAVLAAR